MQLDLEQQRKRAKDLRRAHSAGDADAIARVAKHITPRGARLALSEAQLVIAREAGFASWPQLKHAIEAARVPDLEALLDAAVEGHGGAAAASLHDRGASSSLHLAAARGDEAGMRALLGGVDIAADAKVDSAAHAKVEIDAGAKVDIRAGRRDWTPLLYTCCSRYGRGDPAIVDARIRITRELIARGADVNARGREVGFGSENVDGFDVESWSALAGAAGRVGSAALVRVLVDAGASTEYAPALVKHAVYARDLDVLHAALGAKPPWWQVIWALVACADLDLPAQARVLVPHAESPKSLEPSVLRAIRELRSSELVAILLGDGPASGQQRAVEDAAYRAARRYRHDAAAALLRARGATDAVLSPVDRAIAGAHVDEPLALRDDDHRMLSWTIAKGRLADVPRLLALGLDPNVHDELGELPLHYAVRAASIETIDQLLATGARLDATNFDGESPLAVADGAIADHLRALGAMIGADTSTAAFEQAADAVAAGDLDTLRALLDDEPELVHARSPRTHRCTLLHYTAANGTESPRQRTPPNAPAVAELLLARGADPNATCKLYGGGWATLGLMLTSAHPRAAKVDGELVRVLAKYGARIDADAIDIPVQYASPLAVAALVEAGTPMNLLIAAALDRLDLVEQLLATTDINTRFADGYTALHAAAGMGHARMVEYLLAHGADRTLVDTRWGGTPADKAEYFEHPEIVELLTRA
jgi:ankyrin repeat protein